MTTTAPTTPSDERALDTRAGSSPSPDRSSTSSSRPTRCPRSTTPSRWTSSSTADEITVTAEVAQQIGEGRVRCICMQADRRPRAAARPCATPVGASRPGGRRRPRPRLQRARRAARHRRHRRGRRPLGDPPHRAGLRPARAAGLDVRDRHQGHRPARALRPGRQDRPLRRRRASARPSSSRR